ncbi:cytochrome c oxidase subunit 3 [Microvirga flocculans]|uniref:Cytochrome c oxidase subunit 3 n=1 Tax=Microvirga flocculans TaxID=217168 RepID=A0A7W6N7P1_9HYPH|nr:cytochrome c oxidase subunit 3 [Microvirga flocculans]MBB4039690.1 cytochrome c oxidase subunit 3 [Microvirga flocculans]
MASILFFLSGLAVIAAWWLSRQGLMSKPWLEAGTTDDLPDTENSRATPSKIGLGVFLAVVGSFFALFISAYSMRMQLPDWRNVPVPTILWLNTFMLVLGSLALQRGKSSARRRDMHELRVDLLAAGVSTLAFLSGQLLAWQQLAEEGYRLTGNPANAFFYVVTGAHGLHILGGLVALGRTSERAWRQQDSEPLRQSVELCAMYWHFLLLVWLVFLGILTGWGGAFIDICRQLLT